MHSLELVASLSAYLDAAQGKTWRSRRANSISLLVCLISIGEPMHMRRTKDAYSCCLGDDGRAGSRQLWAAPWQETSSLTVPLQASAHTWLPVSTAFTCAPLVVFQNLWPQQNVHGHPC